MIARFYCGVSILLFLASTASAQDLKRSAIDLADNVKMDFVQIPAGRFIMGSSDKNFGRIWVRHYVTISKPFYMGVTAVTQEQYQAVMGNNPSKFVGPKNPVEMVSWEDADAFCRKLSQKTGKKVKIPTEAQWEYACRAGTNTRFNTGDKLTSDQANFNGADVYGNKVGEARNKTLPVASFKPNAWGLYDMHGNVAQWVFDYYTTSYPRQPVVDPTGPARPEYSPLKDMRQQMANDPRGIDKWDDAKFILRINRGGGYWLPVDMCDSASRTSSIQGERMDSIGFRVCMDAE